MPVRIRLARAGRHKQPWYRLVATDARARRDGRFLETLGAYGPIAHATRATNADGSPPVKRVFLNVPRIRYWLSVGAQPTETVARLLGTAGMLPPSPRIDPKHATAAGTSAAAALDGAHPPPSHGLAEAIE